VAYLVPKTCEIPAIKIRSNFSLKDMNFYSDDGAADDGGGDDDYDGDSTVECQLSEALPVNKKKVTIFPISGYNAEISLSTALEAAMTWCEQQIKSAVLLRCCHSKG
jgi:hypothetical protein